MLNVGERLRGKGAPRWFIFLSNRKKKKENTSLYVRLRPRRSQVAPDRPQSRCSLKFCWRSLSSTRQNINIPNFKANVMKRNFKLRIDLFFLSIFVAAPFPQ